MGAGIFDRAKVEAVFVMFSTVFDMKLKSKPTIYDQIATVMPGVSERVEFKWFSESPTMKKWVGDRAMTRLRAESQAMTTQWWANGLEFDLDDLNKPELVSGFGIRIRRMAAAAGKRIDAETVAMYTGGFAGPNTTYDGQYLYDTDHTSAGNGTGAAQSNLQTGALNSANFNAALQKGMALIDGEGEPLDITFERVLTGTANQLAARTLLQAQFQAGGATNVDEKMASWLITPRITNTAWFLLSDDELRSVIVGIEMPAEFAMVDSPTSEDRFMRRSVKCGAQVKFGTTYAFWQSSIGSQG